MRKATDLCLLCQINQATKTNSHIFPKYLSTSFLGSPRRGYDLNSTTALDKKPAVIQDSPKEDYILCNDCEAYFSILEGIASDTLVNWRKKMVVGQYKIHPILGGGGILECNGADAKTMRLMLYSIFWRSSISSLDFFDNFKIQADFEEELRKTLMVYKSVSGKDYQGLIAAHPNVPVFPIIIITASSFNDGTANILMANYSFDPYCLTCDQYSFAIYKELKDIKHPEMRVVGNISILDYKMIVLPPQHWEDTLVKPAFDIVAKQAIANKKP